MNKYPINKNIVNALLKLYNNLHTKYLSHFDLAIFNGLNQKNISEALKFLNQYDKDLIKYHVKKMHDKKIIKAYHIYYDDDRYILDFAYEYQIILSSNDKDKLIKKAYNSIFKIHEYFIL